MNHVRDYHHQYFSGSQTSMATDTACKRIIRPADQQGCLLCDTAPCTTQRALIAHVGKHMEEVALMALPRGDPNGSEASLGSDDGNIEDRDRASQPGNHHHPDSGRCPYPECGRVFKHLQDHMLIHSSERTANNNLHSPCSEDLALPLDALSPVTLFSLDEPRESYSEQPDAPGSDCGASEREITALTSPHMAIPCEVDLKAERKLSINEVPTPEHSTVSTYSIRSSLPATPEEKEVRQRSQNFEDGLEGEIARPPSITKPKCPYCSTEFTSYHDLKAHFDSYERQYLCDDCEARFCRLHDLKLHLKLPHRRELAHMSQI